MLEQLSAAIFTLSAIFAILRMTTDDRGDSSVSDIAISSLAHRLYLRGQTRHAAKSQSNVTLASQTGARRSPKFPRSSETAPQRCPESRHLAVTRMSATSLQEQSELQQETCLWHSFLSTLCLSFRPRESVQIQIVGDCTPVFAQTLRQGFRSTRIWIGAAIRLYLDEDDASASGFGASCDDAGSRRRLARIPPASRTSAETAATATHPQCCAGCRSTRRKWRP